MLENVARYNNNKKINWFECARLMQASESFDHISHHNLNLSKSKFKTKIILCFWLNVYWKFKATFNRKVS